MLERPPVLLFAVREGDASGHAKKPFHKLSEANGWLLEPACQAAFFVNLRRQTTRQNSTLGT